MTEATWTSERLLYRITLEADTENLVAALSDPKTSECIYWVSKPYTIADAYDWITRAKRGWLSKEEFLFSAFVKDAGDYVGSINLHRKDDNEAEIGYWVASAFHGQGFATEMVSFIITFCASTIRVAHLFATTDTRNVPSQRVLRKNGFLKVADIDTKTHDGDSRASFLFERVIKAGELQGAIRQ